MKSLGHSANCFENPYFIYKFSFFQIIYNKNNCHYIGLVRVINVNDLAVQSWLVKVIDGLELLADVD